MARNLFRPVPISTAGARVRFDTASGSDSPADITPTGSGTPIPGSIVRSDPNGGALPDILGPDNVRTLYQKTLRADGTPTGEVATLTSVGDPSAVPALSTRSFTGGRRVIANRLGNGGTLQAAQNVPLSTRVAHTVMCDASDIRLFYGVNGTSVGPNQADLIKVGVRHGGVVHRVTWNGRQRAVIEGYGPCVMSDPVGIEVKKGDTLYTQPFQTTEWGYTPLAAAVTAGATSFTTNNRPGALSGSVTVESAREVVEVAYWDGTGPYTCYLKSGTTFAGAHASGAVAGGTVFANMSVRADLGDYNVISAVDNSWNTTAFAFNGSALSTTLTQAVAIGDMSIKVVNPTNIGPTCTVDGEVLTVRNVSGAANPYTVHLTAPATAIHNSGATVTGSISVGLGLSPLLIVADRVGTNYRGTFIIVGDSIPNGVGNFVRPSESYALGANGALEEAGFAVINTAISGEAMYQYVDKSVSNNRRAMYSAAEYCLFTYGVNDAYNSRSSAQMIADATAILTDIKARGLKVVVATLTPRTTSSDWTTTGGQTSVNAGTMGAVVLAYNAWVRAGAGGLADRVCDFADATMSARDSNIWKADAAGPYTSEGIHPTYAGHMLLMKPALAAVLATI